MKKRKFRTVTIIILAAALGLTINLGYYLSSTGTVNYCFRCHEIRPAYDQWAASSHREIQCKECHGSSLTLDPSFHAKNLHELVTHIKGEIPRRIILKDSEVDRASESCGRCHANKQALWKAGGHSMSYADVYLNPAENHKTLLNNDCLRCHGMFFEGRIEDIVAPLDTTGPWSLADPSLAGRPAIPCLACHRIHCEGKPGEKPDYAKPLEISYARQSGTFSLAFYDHREREHYAAAVLQLPAMTDQGRPAIMSPDKRQGLCYQCHAPEPVFEVASRDDRTPVGVHEGISCLGCHDSHSLDARASCDNCHPKMSNCGLDVATMNTTFKSLDSPHNIHRVKCLDCHTQGIPEKKQPLLRISAGPQPGRELAALHPAPLKRP